MKLLNIIIVILITSSCAGYKPYINNNPFKNYGIKSISIPIFVNKSVLPAISAKVTRSVVKVLFNYKNLKIYSGENYRADAFLIGIIESNDKINNVFKPGGDKFADGDLKKSIGSRQSFFIPTNSSYSYNVKIYLIKDPSNNIIKLLKSKIPNNVKIKYPKLIFFKEFTATTAFDRQLKETTSVNSAGLVNFTQAQGNFYDSLDQSASSIATQFNNAVTNEL